MADLLITAEMPMLGADAGDKVVNTFAFHKPGNYVAGEAAQLFTELQEFYSINAVVVARSPASYLSGVMDRGSDVCSFKAYDITGKLGNEAYIKANGTTGYKPPAHGSPIAEGTWELDAAGSNTPLPNQCAAVLTLRARDALQYPVEAPDSGDPDTRPDRPRARRTGRLYFGPLNQLALNAGNGQQPARLDSTFRAVMLEKAEYLQDGVNALGYAWCVWSRQNAALSVIERVEIDDSFDVIRRRKAASTARDVRDFVPVPDLALGA